MTDDRNSAVAAEFELAHPGAAALLRQRGADAERARVTAHLDMGKSCHAEDHALEAVRAGTEMTASETAHYVTASMNYADRYARQRESDLTERQLAGAAVTGPVDLGDAVAEALSKPKATSLVRP